MITRLNAVLLLLIAPRAAAVVARCANATDCTDELMQAINTCEDVFVPAAGV